MVFKYHWFDPNRLKQKPDIGWVEVERSSVYVGDDVYILASQAFQVFYLPYPCKNLKKRLQGWDVVITVLTRGRPPLPNKDDYRLDTSRYDADFFQEEGLPGKFTINLEIDEDMVEEDIEGEEDKAAHMEEETPQYEVEEVQNHHDLTLLERFHQCLDLDDPAGPPPDYMPDYWWGNLDSDDKTFHPRVGPSDIDTGYLSCEACLFVIHVFNSDLCS
jgi:hypothetical protein